MMINDMEHSARRVCLYMETKETPHGIVTKETIDDGPIGPAHYSAVKYIARHVSDTLPEPYIALDENNMIELKAAFRGFDSSGQPPFVQLMLKTLLADEMMPLPEELYEAAFKTEILGGRDFLKFLSTPENYVNWVYQLLFHAGYPVVRVGPLPN